MKKTPIGVNIVNQDNENFLIARVPVEMLLVISQAHLLSQLAIVKFRSRVWNIQELSVPIV